MEDFKIDFENLCAEFKTTELKLLDILDLAMKNYSETERLVEDVLNKTRIGKDD